MTKYPKGWAFGKREEELLQGLVSINGTVYSYWEEILTGFNQRKLPPVILINDKLCDGAHRTIMAYLFNTPIRLAHFKS